MTAIHSPTGERYQSLQHFKIEPGTKFAFPNKKWGRGRLTAPRNPQQAIG